MNYISTYATPMGEVTLASDGQSLTGLWLEAQRYFGATLPGESKREDDLPVFAATRQWLSSYFAGERPPISAVSLAPAGSEFRRRVWDILCEIPYGGLTTYGEIARRMAKLTGKRRMASQAVGGAVGHNPISIIIPCHRVVGSSGSLVGYGGGIQRKMQLLELEGVDISKLSVPSKGTAL